MCTSFGEECMLFLVGTFCEFSTVRYPMSIYVLAQSEGEKSAKFWQSVMFTMISPSVKVFLCIQHHSITLVVSLQSHYYHVIQTCCHLSKQQNMTLISKHEYHQYHQGTDGTQARQDAINNLSYILCVGTKDTRRHCHFPNHTV